MRIVVTYDIPERNQHQINSLATDPFTSQLETLPDWIEGFPKTIEVRGQPRLQCS